VRTKKTPGPRRAGTATDRSISEATALEQLDELRAIAPEIYMKMLNLLATMVVSCGRLKKSGERRTRTKF
jgi:hypothetical protein